MHPLSMCFRWGEGEGEVEGEGERERERDREECDDKVPSPMTALSRRSRSPELRSAVVLPLIGANLYILVLLLLAYQLANGPCVCVSVF